MRVRKVLWLIILLVAVFLARPLWEEKASEYVDLSFLASIDETIAQVKDDPSLSEGIEEAKQFTVQIGGQLESMVRNSTAEMPEAAAKPELDEAQALFAVHNVTLGMTK